jgi:GNAT superfamily N-acetyltransferase
MTKEELMGKQMKIAEEIYGTEVDPDQIPITDESMKRLDSLCHGWMETVFDEAGEPISWAVVMPTQRAVAEKFLNKEITEREVLELTEPAAMYDAVYIVSVITVPEHRGKGLGKMVLEKALANMPVTPDALYVAWPTTPEGLGMFKKYETFLGKEIKLRK